jgi:stage II sporulation protein AA (anti-sigma F factor antagonist)
VTVADVFHTEIAGNTLIICPLHDLRELDQQELQQAGEAVLDALVHSPIQNVVIDLSKTDYFGSTALGVFVALWQETRRRMGRMALCNLSAHEREILEVTRLDDLWRLCSSRQDAICAVGA